MRTSRTFAILEVSRAAYDEIRELLKEAGYEHAFVDELIDMHGIALQAPAGDEHRKQEP